MYRGTGPTFGPADSCSGLTFTEPLGLLTQIKDPSPFLLCLLPHFIIDYLTILQIKNPRLFPPTIP